MAEQVTIDIPGIGTVVAENAASEATLRAILAAMNGLNGRSTSSGNNQNQLNTNAINSSLSRLSGGLQMLGTVAGTAANGLNLVSRSAGAVTGALVSVTSGLSQLNSTLATSMQSYSRLDGSVTRAADEMARLPVIGKMFGETMKAVALAQTDLVTNFQKASSAGADFAGNVSIFAANASMAGTTLDKFSSFISSNGDALRALGGTTEEGARRFGVLSKSLRDSSETLYALGYSAADLNEGLAQYARMQQYSGNVRKKSDADLVSGTRAYMEELDMLSKITGESRKSKAEEMEGLRLDTQVSSFTDSLADPGKAADTLTSVLAEVGKTTQGFYKDVIAAGVPTTEQNRLLAATYPETYSQLQKMNREFKETSTVSEQSKQKLREIQEKEARDKASTLGALPAQVGGALDSVIKVKNETVKLAADRAALAKKEQDESYKANRDMQVGYEKLKAQVAGVGNMFTDMLARSGVFKLLTQMFTLATATLEKVAKPAFEWFGNIVGKVTNVLSAKLTPAFELLGKIAEQLPAVFSTVFGPIASRVGDWFSELLSPLGDSLSGVTGDADSLANKLAEGLSSAIDHTWYTMQNLWLEAEKLVIKFQHWSSVSTWDDIVDRFNLIKLGAEELYDGIRDFTGSLSNQDMIDGVKVGFMGLRVGIDTAISTWNGVVTWFNNIKLSLMSLVDGFNIARSFIDPRYSKADLAKDMAESNAERTAIATQKAHAESFETDRAERQAQYDAAKKQLESNRNDERNQLNEELAKNKLARDAERAAIQESMKNRKVSEDDYTAKLEAIHQKQLKLQEDLDNKDLARSENVQADMDKARASQSASKTDYDQEIAKQTAKSAELQTSSAVANTTVSQNMKLFSEAMTKQGVTDPKMRAAMAAVAEGESGFKMHSESGYGGTSNDRIRGIFKTKTRGMGDDELTALKKDPKAFFNKMYGDQLGNKAGTDDGYNFRGRGMIQLTGRDNYAKYGKLAGYDLEKNPELMNKADVAAAVSVAYMKSRTNVQKHGGDVYEAVARGVGNSVKETEAVKTAAFARNLQSGKFNEGGSAQAVSMESAELKTAKPATSPVVPPKEVAAFMPDTKETKDTTLLTPKPKDTLDDTLVTPADTKALEAHEQDNLRLQKALKENDISKIAAASMTMSESGKKAEDSMGPSAKTAELTKRRDDLQNAALDLMEMQQANTKPSVEAAEKIAKKAKEVAEMSLAYETQIAQAKHKLVKQHEDSVKTTTQKTAKEKESQKLQVAEALAAEKKFMKEHGPESAGKDKDKKSAKPAVKETNPLAAEREKQEQAAIDAEKDLTELKKGQHATIKTHSDIQTAGWRDEVASIDEQKAALNAERDEIARTNGDVPTQLAQLDDIHTEMNDLDERRNQLMADHLGELRAPQSNMDTSKLSTIAAEKEARESAAKEKDAKDEEFRAAQLETHKSIQETVSSGGNSGQNDSTMHLENINNTMSQLLSINQSIHSVNESQLSAQQKQSNNIYAF